MNHLISRRALTVALALMACPLAIEASDDSGAAAGGIAFHYVARVKLNFLDNSGIVYGYVTTLSGVPDFAPLFKGTPSEATAYVTFRANIRFTFLPGNGPLGPGQFAVTPILVDAGSWSIYFSASPAHNWDDPDTFSNGQTVATLDRAPEQFSVYPTFSINAGGATIRSSAPFTLGGQTINFRDLAPRGLVPVTSGSPIPLNGSTATAPIFGASGYALVSAR